MTTQEQEKHYIASTSVHDRPHVVAQWEGDRLVEVIISVLEDDAVLEFHDVIDGYRVAKKLYDRREEC